MSFDTDRGRSYLKEILGKTIDRVVLVEQKSSPKWQLFLVFTDDTHMEFFGNDFANAKGLWPRSDGHLLKSGRGREVLADFRWDKKSLKRRKRPKEQAMDGLFSYPQPYQAELSLWGDAPEKKSD